MTRGRNTIHSVDSGEDSLGIHSNNERQREDNQTTTTHTHTQRLSIIMIKRRFLRIVRERAVCNTRSSSPSHHHHHHHHRHRSGRLSGLSAYSTTTTIADGTPSPSPSSTTTMTSPGPSVTLEDIEDAYKRVSPLLDPSPLTFSPRLTAELKQGAQNEWTYAGSQLFFKMEVCYVMIDFMCVCVYATCTKSRLQCRYDDGHT